MVVIAYVGIATRDRPNLHLREEPIRLFVFDRDWLSVIAERRADVEDTQNGGDSKVQ